MRYKAYSLEAGNEGSAKEDAGCNPGRERYYAILTASSPRRGDSIRGIVSAVRALVGEISTWVVVVRMAVLSLHLQENPGTWAPVDNFYE